MLADRNDAIRVLKRLAPHLKKEFLLTSLAIFDDPVNDTKTFRHERDHWEKIIEHMPGLVEPGSFNINVAVNLPPSFPAQELVAFWNDLTKELERALHVKVHLFQFEFESEMKNPVLLFKETSAIEGKTPEEAVSDHDEAKDVDADKDQSDDDDGDNELDDSDFDRYWNI
nr:hypothetical protein [Candidatus Sigynarchaeota archaeon]